MGSISLGELLAAAEGDEVVAKMKVLSVLESLPGVGKVKARRVMDEIGIDLSKHRPKTFDDLEDTSFDLIVSLSPEAQHQAVELTRTMACDVEFWNTFDPSLIEGNRETRLQAYRGVRDQLKRRIEERFTLDLKPQH